MEGRETRNPSEKNVVSSEISELLQLPWKGWKRQDLPGGNDFFGGGLIGKCWQLTLAKSKHIPGSVGICGFSHLLDLGLLGEP